MTYLEYLAALQLDHFSAGEIAFRGASDSGLGLNTDPPPELWPNMVKTARPAPTWDLQSASCPAIVRRPTIRPFPVRPNPDIWKTTPWTCNRSLQRRENSTPLYLDSVRLAYFAAVWASTIP